MTDQCKAGFTKLRSTMLDVARSIPEPKERAAVLLSLAAGAIASASLWLNKPIQEVANDLVQQIEKHPEMAKPEAL